MVKPSKQDEVQPIIIKKIKKSEGAHHGGAWKVAYADFVTAMMAFFLLLWLLNVSTDEARETISNYFDPSHPRISQTTSGAGGLMGGQSVQVEGAMVTNVQDLTQPAPTGATGQGEADETDIQKSPDGSTRDADLKALEEKLREEEQKRFEEAKAELEKRIQEDPELAALAKNLIIDITEEGLRIQVVDQDGRPMFPSGKAEMYDYTQKLMATVADVIKSMPNNISVRGHTDAYKYKPDAKYTNWELSADRANSSRRVLLNNGVDIEKLANVMGKADREHYIAEDPFDARNRRISIILLKETMDHAFRRGAFDDETKTSPPKASETGQTTNTGKPVGTFKKTPGEVYFP